MNKRPCINLLLFVIFPLILFSACQSGTSETAAENENTAVATEIPIESSAPPPTESPASTETPQVLDTVTPLPTDEPAAAPTETATPAPSPTPEPGIIRSYVVNPEQSEVRFMINEVLFGNPKTVVGRTNQVEGEIQLDLQNPQAVEVSPITINARELATDDSFRNRALRRQILDSAQDEYQFIVFTPTSVDGIGDAAPVIGEAQSFELSGELQIRDVMQPVTFQMVVTAVSETELSGSGEATVLRSDFGLQIPSVTGVADVSDEVILEIEFVAQAVDA